MLTRARTRLQELRETALARYDPAPIGDCRIASVMPPSHYEEAVARAVDRIRAGAMEKIVLAREVEDEVAHAHDAGALLGLLREEFPSSFVYAVGRGDDGDIGSPHRRRPETTVDWPPVMEALALSVVIPARNERARIPALIASIESQTLTPQAVIVADGMSDDGTREWLRDAAAQRPWLHMVDNPARTISAALNAAIAAAQTPLVARMDAHAVYADEYLERIVRVFAGDCSVVAVGGSMRTEGDGPWGASIATVLRRRFGLGGAGHRVGAASGPVDHAFSPTYRRDAVIAAGGFDEAMLANEDFELDHRLRRAGGTVWLEATASCTWFTRDSLDATARQMFRYGNFKARTLWLWPRSLRLRQLAPPALILVLGLATVRGRRAAGATWAAYLGGCGVLAARAASQDGTSARRAAVVVPVVHLSWGAGLLAGVWTHRRPRRHARTARRIAPAVAAE